MIKVIERLIGYERLTVTPRERVLVLTKGRFDRILGTGEHRVKRRNTVREVHDLQSPRFTSLYADALIRERPDLAEELLLRFETGPGEVLMVLRDGRPLELLGPETRATYLREAGPFEVESIPVTDRLDVAPALAKRLARLGTRSLVQAVTIPEGYIGLLTVNGEPRGRVEAGVFSHLDLAGYTVDVRLVDTRLQTHEVTGQEILTRDRVTIRVNLTVDYRVADPECAVGAVGNYRESLHRAVQLAFRRTLGAMTLDQLLADKVTVDAEAAETVRRDMAGIGLEVRDIALKDVILPGEMRDILNRVVEVEKEAEANVIRRREETNATRSLLNTAKVMAENPVMLRLKELEALESIAEKVDRLTVHNGTKGLLDDIVQLRD